MQGTVVAVLRGGPSREHEVSLKTGHALMTHLPEEDFLVRDIFIDKEGVWHERGRPVSPATALRAADLAVIGLHGEYGEDGEVQKILERLGVPYTGSDATGSFLAIHKLFSKERARAAGLRTPQYRFIEPRENLEAAVAEIIRVFPQPVVVKPVRWGSSIGVSVVSGYAPLFGAIAEIIETTGGVLVEERIRGTEATVGVVEGLRGEELYVFPPIEIVPPEAEMFFSLGAKYSGESEEICPGRFSKSAAKELIRAARLMHRELGLRDYSRSDFIVAPRGIYYLETNALPGLSKESLFPKGLAALGVSMREFTTHLAHRALHR